METIFPEGKSYPTKTCENCGKDFPQRRRWARFCSASCRWEAWNRRHPRRKGAGQPLEEEGREEPGETAGAETGHGDGERHVR